MSDGSRRKVPGPRGGNLRGESRRSDRAGQGEGRGERRPDPELPKRGLGRDEQKYFGKNACQAIFDTRPEEIVRVYVTERMTKPFGALLSFCAKEKKAFHVIAPEELEKVTGSEHHQGIALIAKKRGASSLAASLREGGAISGCLLYLDGVENPHNFGAILRSCGYFTIAGVVGMKGELPQLSGTACRTAEGAAEMVSLWEIEKVAELAALKRKGFRVVATSSHAKRSLYGAILPENCVIVLGSEGRGISPEVLALADEEVAIPGAGAVESLNVSAACAVILGEYVRQRGERKESAKRESGARKKREQLQEGERKIELAASRNGFHHHRDQPKGGKRRR